jgi:hypothetical protein
VPPERPGQRAVIKNGAKWSLQRREEKLKEQEKINESVWRTN